MNAIRILIVDDSPVILSCLVPFLETKEEIRIIGTACDGYEALNLVDELVPDVVLLDLNMPGLNGIETASRLRKMFPQICIVLTSTMYKNGNYLVEIAREAGVDDFISKIDLADQLIPTIHQSLHRNEQLAVEL